MGPLGRKGGVAHSGRVEWAAQLVAARVAAGGQALIGSGEACVSGTEVRPGSGDVPVTPNVQCSVPRGRCPVCGAAVRLWANENGSRVYFEGMVAGPCCGATWPPLPEQMRSAHRTAF